MIVDPVEALPADEKRCTLGLRNQGIPSVRLAFAQHAAQHGLECDRYAEIWMRELLVEAAAAFATANREAGNAHLSSENNFVTTAKAAWRELQQRRARAG